MSYQYKLIIYNKNAYKEFEIPADMQRARVGTTTTCDFRLNSDYFFGDIEILLEKNDGWTIQCSDNLFFNRGDVRKLYFSELSLGDQFPICYYESGEIAFSLRFMIDFEAEIPNYCWRIDLNQKKRIVISNQIDADIELESEFGIDTLVFLKTNADSVELEEMTSKYGTYVNGKKITGCIQLNNFDFISIADFSAYYRNNTLFFSHKNVKINNIQEIPDYLMCETTYPLFVRNTRVKSKCDEEPISVLDPAAIPTKPEQNIVTSLLPAIVMFVLVVVLRGIMNTSGGSFVLFSICSMGLGVITSVISIINTKKKYKKDCEERISTYQSYIEKKRKEIENARREELECLRNQYYSTMQDLTHIESFSPCLFDRIPVDDDFLDVYLGIGRTEAMKKIDYKRQEVLQVGDELCEIPIQLSEEYKYIYDAPVIVGLKNANAIGVVGEQSLLYEMMKCILVDIISRQYFGDVNLYMILGEDYEKYDWIRLLPHIQGYTSQRNIVCDTESKNNIYENLYKELSMRSEAKEQSGYNVIFVMNERGIKSHPISKFIENASALNTVFIFFERDTNQLPLYCSRIIQMQEDNHALFYETQNKAEKNPFMFASVPDDRIKNAIYTLAPVYCEEISLESTLRKNISMFELLGIYSVEDLNLKERWQSTKIYDSMAVPMGVNAKNDIVYLDLHEKFHGPHGLVAGTTGSGKSEILQTFILGAATLFHPYEIGFVIIDFKGGGMVNQFKDLPHLIGAITNIDGKAIDRSLKSIKAELLKRQELFAEAGVNHIDKYIKAYKEGKVKTALPHLVIIVDEFAELKAEQPEFMKELISAARIGRSLGVHLILATQKPAGQVNEQIWSNSKFKLCLKVQTKEDSNEVLKSPLAAEIREPGRAYLQVGNNEVFELFQSGFSGKPEKSDSENQKSFDIYSMDFKGSRKLIYRQRPKKTSDNRTQLEAIVDYVSRYCEAAHIKRLPKICLPALADEIVCDVAKYGCEKNLGVDTVIGIYDDPDHQYQGSAQISVGTANTIIIGSTQYGKTNLLEVIIRSLAETYSPAEINMYIIDFASMVLKNFEKLAHVGGVVCPSDDEKLKNLFKYLNDQIATRREKLLSVGVSSFTSYKEAGYDDLPQILVLIDNMTMLKELFLQDNDVLLNLCREGNSVGISFVITNAQTSGLGYKYLANFATRISLFCNETSEYASLFGSCKTQPDEVPGRCLIEIEKTLYECQTFLAFEGEKEIERIQQMQSFIEHVNQKYKSVSAVPIPEIPAVLGEMYVYEHFMAANFGSKYMLGLDYDTVAPCITDISKVNMLALSGPEETGKSNFMRYFVHSITRKDVKVETYIFDDYRKKLSDVNKSQNNVSYFVGATKYKDILTLLDKCLQERYQALVSGENLTEEWKILILNNEDVYAEISNDKESLTILKNIVGKFKMLHVFVIFGAIPNAQITFGSLEVYKMIKETRNILFFDNLENCKLVDVSLATIRKKQKEPGNGRCILYLR